MSPGTSRPWLSSRPPPNWSPTSGLPPDQFLPKNAVPAAHPLPPPSALSSLIQRLSPGHSSGSPFRFSSPSEPHPQPRALPRLQPLPQSGSEPPAPAPGASRCKRALPRLLPPPTPPQAAAPGCDRGGVGLSVRVPAPGAPRGASHPLSAEPRVRSPRRPPGAPARRSGERGALGGARAGTAEAGEAGAREGEGIPLFAAAAPGPPAPLPAGEGGAERGRSPGGGGARSSGPAGWRAGSAGPSSSAEPGTARFPPAPRAPSPLIHSSTSRAPGAGRGGGAGGGGSCRVRPGQGPGSLGEAGSEAARALRLPGEGVLGAQTGEEWLGSRKGVSLRSQVGSSLPLRQS